MPSEDVSDLRDVVDAINKLCDTMKTSYDGRDAPDESIEPPAEKCTDRVEHVESVISESEPIFEKMQTTRSRGIEKPITIQSDPIEEIEEPIMVRSDTIEEMIMARSDPIEEIEEPIMIRSDPIEEMIMARSDPIEEIEEPIMVRSDPIKEMIMARSDPIEEIEEPIMIRSDPIEEMIMIRSDPIEEITKPIRSDPMEEIEEPMTISSNPIEEIETVISDSELMSAEPMQYEPTSEMYFTASSEVSLLSDMDVQERLGLSDDSEKRRDDRNSVMAGHVAAMREHFESMTRTNTPCPDQLRSSSPSIEVFRTVTNSPDI